MCYYGVFSLDTVISPLKRTHSPVHALLFLQKPLPGVLRKSAHVRFTSCFDAKLYFTYSGLTKFVLLHLSDQQMMRLK